MRLLTFDTEGTYGKSFGRVCNPFNGTHTLSSIGWKANTSSAYTDLYYVTEDITGKRVGSIPTNFPAQLDSITHLVGANLKHDLLWYWGTPELRAYFKTGGKIWDVLYAEYLLSGQFYNNKQGFEHLRPSLKAIAKRRLPADMQKLDVVKQLWEQGIRTEDVPEDTLLEYQKYDVLCTEAIAVQQINEAIKNGMYPMMDQRHEGYLAVIEMEYNGLYIDQEVAQIETAKLEKEVAELKAQLSTFLVGFPDDLEFLWTSDQQLSALIFGGQVEYTKRIHKTDPVTGELLYAKKTIKEPMLDDFGMPIVFKSGLRTGEPRYRSTKVPDYTKPKMGPTYIIIEFPGMTTPKDSWANSHGYSTAADILEEIEKRGIPVVEHLLKFRGKEKDLGTYFIRTNDKGVSKGMLTQICDGVIHHGLNLFVTKTGRLSSSNPNLQNVSDKSKSSVKKLFSSRFGDDGIMVSADYGQVEVYAKAILSGDTTLLQALYDDLDQHCEWLSFITGEPYDVVYQKCTEAMHPDHDAYKLKRKKVKPITFGEQYGEGVTALARDSKLPGDTIKAAIEERKRKYPKMYAFDETVRESIQKTRRPSCLRTKSGHVAGIGYYQDVTGTIYHFMEVDAMDWQIRKGQYTSFPPPIIKNYPSQGLGGFILQVASGRVYRALAMCDFFNGEVLMCNNVHDEIVFDMHKKWLPAVSSIVLNIMKDVSPFFNSIFSNVNWDINFKVDLDVGPDLWSLEKYEQEEVTA